MLNDYSSQPDGYGPQIVSFFEMNIKISLFICREGAISLHIFNGIVKVSASLQCLGSDRAPGILLTSNIMDCIKMQFPFFVTFLS